MAHPQERIASYGRGGAGNFGKEEHNPPHSPEDLATPTLKSNTYTTGRGGSGNMAKNDPEHPELARAAQDVEAPSHRESEGASHYGRGGAANIVKGPGAAEQPRTSGEGARRSADGRTDERGLGEKAKDLLHKLGGGKK